ncbi:F-box/LRR-repeat protein 4 [Eucalyptus grandis]|uniref:F-box/LRR-repeat protein 4 n=1 Tax=Eucalyptus grandis TaxID=71139 RepID=UPI00192EDEE6|nr:F-box/LRR-repeat protein 4 [Eucalyptus grandis]
MPTLLAPVASNPPILSQFPSRRCPAFRVSPIASLRPHSPTMSAPIGGGGGGGGGEAGPPGVCINDVLTDDELRSVLARLESEKDREIFGLVCKRWLALQSAERRRLAARAGPHMLAMLAARFGRVVELDLSQSVSRSFYPGVTDADLAVVARKFKRLKVLNLSHCKGITDKGMLEIGDGLSTLQSLDVSFCRKLTDRGLEAVARGCHDMRTLHLASCRAVSDVLLLGLSRNCPNLEELVLEGCTNITDQGITDLVGGCQKIKLLDVSKCSNVGDVGISNVAKSCSSSLRTLKLLDCCKVGDQSVLSLASFCMGLETLVVSGCRDISDESLKSLAAACGNSLKTLGMNWCLNVSDLSLSSILAQCRYLEALDIGCCEEVTDAAFQGLASVEDVLSLKFLKISNCPNITVTGLGIILDKCRSLEYLDLRSCPHISKTACDEAMLRFPDCCKVNYVGRLSEPDMKL